ncbi:chromosome segregation protein SMC [Chlorobium ferrooxidans]|uniref:Chromosome partition protein Smc n=1 Tax=Chlorobium ferrooxidans DSM 13031 TaxID=377431 RepID=Q0YTQ3_9CHLB|nr:chromosome segregation protein SMC [Chlorobium ferrooxidans]EAT59847.1 Chromosome segregation protein SMC [Chlorobium ferrooxidans DSM 13031]
MYLSKIELFGFKSFAHKVRISFDKGLTAIVGPNGCGKTNVVDAMRWVLGEQKSSLLRSAKMENIIFNGSKNLKPLSLTEVSITVENTKNVLPIEYTEVTVTRRLYRSGESEFLLNQVPCRLKDILDLFTDTGMGSDAYSVIELKMIEEIISNKSEERLKLFEEAAGITRYKQRRKQTFKLLESASRDLSRVDDVLAEVEKKVRSLKLQVRKAEKLRELKKEIRELDLALSWLSMEELREKLEPMRQRIREEELRNHECTAKIATEDSITQERELGLLQEETTLSETQKSLNERNQQIHLLEKQLLQHEEHQKNLVSVIARTAAIITEKEQSISEQEQLKNELLQQSVPCEESCSELYDAFKSLADEHDRLDRTLRRERDELSRERRRSAEQQSADNQLALTKRSLESKKEHLRTSVERLETKKVTILQKLAEAAESDHRLSEEINRKQNELGEAKTRESLLLEHRESINARIEEKREALLLRRYGRDKLHNRILLANSVLDNFEGMPEGLAFLEKQKNGTTGLGCISDLLSLDDRYRKAVNAALGESMNYYVCRSLSEAREGIANLTKSDKGKVHFLVLDLVDGSAAGEYKALNGAEKTLDVIDCPPELQAALCLALGKSYITESLQEAETLALQHPDCSFVTLEGEKFSGSGVLFGGSSKNSEGLRLGKKSERERLQKEVAAIEKTIQKEEESLRILREELGSIKTAEQRRDIERLESELGALEKRAARIDAEKNGMKQESEQTGREIESLIQQKNSCDTELQKLLPSITDSEAKGRLIRDTIRKLQESLTSFENRYHELGRDVQTRQSRYKDGLLELEKLKLNIAAADQRLTTLHDEISRMRAEKESSEKEISRGSGASLQIREKLDSLRILSAEEQKRLNELESAYRERQAQHHETLGQLRDLRRKHEVGMQLLSALLQERSQLDQSLDHLFTAVQLKHDCDLAIMSPPAIDNSFDRKKAAEKLEQLLRQREQFGAVNELALEEYETEKERFDFLTEQKEDLLSAETQLRTTIDEINKTALEKFEATWREVRKNFITIFHELFDPEDEVDLIMHAGEDPLEAHIEIVAKPRGKKPLSIEQLSGGEKALTALSLLFAIYLVKPSPFCILDEVDAPLDDANVGRFIKLLKKFENNTQFIIVTHNKKTMASCQALYGVTMEEEGVSKLIPVRLENIRN